MRRAVCPYVPTAVESRDIPDLAGLPLEQVRPIRDEIEARVRELIDTKLDAISSNRTAHQLRLVQLLPGLAKEFEGQRSDGDALALTRSCTSSTTCQ